MSRASSGPARRGATTRSRPSTRPSAGREADRIKDPRAGWAAPTSAARTLWRSGPLPVPVAGVAAGLWAALTGLALTTVMTLVIWIFAAGESSSDTAMRVGSDVWLATHAVPFRIGTGVWTLMPWAWVVFPGVVLWAAGRWVAHRAAIAHPKSLFTAAGSLAAAYGIAGMLAALFGTLSGAGAMPLRAFLHTGLLALLVSGAAMAWRANLGRGALARAWRISRPAVAALAVLILGASIVLAVALIASHSRLAQTLQLIEPGAFGSLALALGWLGYLPTALMWALSYVVGPGVQVGGTTVTPLEPIGVPIDFFGLELLPATAQPWWLLGVGIPVAAGVVMSRLAGAAQTRRQWWSDRAAATGILLIVIDLWWVLSVGRLGEGRLDLLGPSPLVIPALIAGVCLGVAGEQGWLAILRWRERRSIVDVSDVETSDDVPA